MILSDREIQNAIDDGLIGIDPPPDVSRISSTSVDLVLDSGLIRWKESIQLPSGSEPDVRPARGNFNVQELSKDPSYAEHITIGAQNGFRLEPGRFVLGYTKERIQLPSTSRIAARVEGKSSLARVGVGIHVTAPIIHAGFGFKADEPSHKGTPIQLEIFNLGPLVVILDVGMPICQLILEEVRERPSIGYRGQFQEQSTFTEET